MFLRYALRYLASFPVGKRGKRLFGGTHCCVHELREVQFEAHVVYNGLGCEYPLRQQCI